MRASRVGLLALLGAGALLAGCGAGRSLVSASVTAFPSRGPHYLGPISAPVTYRNSGVELTVPPTDAQPAATWQDALATCASGKSVCTRGHDPEISLASGTTTSSGSVDSHGRFTPLFKDRLVYVMTWTGEPCASSGPAGSTGGSVIQHCVLLSFVDAQTAQPLLSVQSPDP